VTVAEGRKVEAADVQRSRICKTPRRDARGPLEFGSKVLR